MNSEKIKGDKSSKGFTLIELIIVIAILGILALIAVPKFSGYVDKANEAADKQLGYVVANGVQVLIASGDIEVNAADKQVITFKIMNGTDKDDGLIYTYSGGDLTPKGDDLNKLINDLVDPDSRLSSNDKQITFTITADGNVQQKDVKVESIAKSE